MNKIRKNGVKKSDKLVTKGINKLLGSFPFLNKKIEAIYKQINKEQNKSTHVIKMIEIIKNGLII